MRPHKSRACTRTCADIAPGNDMRKKAPRNPHQKRMSGAFFEYRQHCESGGGDPAKQCEELIRYVGRRSCLHVRMCGFFPPFFSSYKITIDVLNKTDYNCFTFYFFRQYSEFFNYYFMNERIHRGLSSRGRVPLRQTNREDAHGCGAGACALTGGPLLPAPDLQTSLE